MALEMKRLVMIMRMTESDSDGEALNAIRQANKMLKAEGKHWGDVIGFAAKTASVSPDYRTPPSKRGKGTYGRPASQKRHDDGVKHRGDDIEQMLSALGDMRHEVTTLMLLAGIRDFWERNSFLTTPQYETIKGMYERTTQPRGGHGKWRF